jgi:hypothetical protein
MKTFADDAIELLEAVQYINDTIANQVGDEEGSLLNVNSDGYNFKVIFLDSVIYKSYEDERPVAYDTYEYMSIQEYLILECNKILKILKSSIIIS